MRRRQEDALKLRALRARIRSGLDDLERGDFVDVEDDDLDRFLEELRPEAFDPAR
jgi:predicted transcriptional regulator